MMKLLVQDIPFGHGAGHSPPHAVVSESPIEGGFATLRRWLARRRQRKALAELAAGDIDRLRDIGISATQARREAQKPFWQQ